MSESGVPVSGVCCDIHHTRKLATYIYCFRNHPNDMRYQRICFGAEEFQAE